MSLTAILSAIAALGTIAGALYGVFRWASWKGQVVPETTKEGIDKQIDSEEKVVTDTGRPA